MKTDAMKKTYTTPLMQVYTIQHSDILTVSGTIYTDDGKDIDLGDYTPGPGFDGGEIGDYEE